MKKVTKYVFTSLFLLIVSFFAFDNVYAGSDTEITFGSEYSFNMASTSRISTTDLSSSKFVTIYQDGGGDLNYGTAVIGNVSGNVISYGSEYVFNSGNTDYLSVATLSDNKFMVIYQDISNSNYGTAVIGNVSGNTITYGSEYVFNTSATDYIFLKNLSLDKIVIAYQDGGNSDYGTAVIGDISGNVITFGSEYVFNQSVTSYVSPVVLSDNKFVVTYQDRGGNLNYGTAIIGNVSGNTIIYGLEYVFNTGATSYVSADILDENKFVISYQGNSGLNYGRAIIGVVSDDIINFDLKYTFNPSSTNCNSISALSNSKFIIAYQDGGGNLNYGTSIIGSIPVEEIIEPEPEPIPEPESVPTPNPEPITKLNDGDLIRNPNIEDLTKFDIYIVKIVGDKKFKRLILSPHVFESYEHLNWEDVKDVNQTTMDAYTVSNLIRAVGDDRVYKLFPSGDIGTKQWLNISAEEFVNQGYDSNSIYEINSIDRDAYIEFEV